MAQAGFTPISLYFSSTAAAVPTAGNLANGELALNIADMKLYAKNSAGTVTLLASSGGASGTVSSVAVSGGTTGLTTSGGPITTSGTITLAGTLATTNGGTGLTSFTSGGVVYASSSSALATGSALTFDGTNFATTGSGTFSGLLSRIHAQGTDAYITNTTTGKANTVMGFNDSGSTNAQGVPTGYAYYGNLQTYPIAFTTNGSLTYVTGSTAHTWYISGTRSMDLNSTGLGIGTNSPVAELEVFNPAVNTAFVPNTLSTWRVAQIRNDQTGTSGSAAGLAFVGTSSTQPAGIVAINSNTTGGIVSLGFLTVNGNTVQESFRFGPAGQFGIGGATYGNAGEVLTSGGASAAPTWAAAGGGGQVFAAFGGIESVFASQGF